MVFRWRGREGRVGLDVTHDSSSLMGVGMAWISFPVLLRAMESVFRVLEYID